jgi:phosphoribosylformylglycinamidine cyclo-ligase
MYRQKFPDSFDPNTPEEVVYVGSKQLTDMITVDGEDIPAGKLVLSPTRTYLPVFKKVFDEYRSQINGIIHNTGGGQSKVLKFVDGKHIIKDNMLPVPPLFHMIQSESGTEWKEMYQVFNMGQRLEFYVPETIARGIIDIAKSFNIDARIVGRVEDADKNTVTIQSDYGTFTYQ